LAARLPRRAHLEGAEGAGLRRPIAVAIALATLALAAGAGARERAPAPDPRPNILVVLTDDQTLDTLPSDPPAMPWLQSQIKDPAGHWIWFPNAVASTPLCCPSRATILTGSYDTQTGVRDNLDGPLLDDTNTLPVWLQRAGYTTGLVGKYLNNYPWGRTAFVPPGWDRWFAKENADESTAYYDYDVADQGYVRHYGAVADVYATDVLGGAANAFLEQAPSNRPWFLYFAPNAPHLPWIPAPRYADVSSMPPPTMPSLEEMNDVGGKPPYVRVQPPRTQEDLDRYRQDDLRERAMLRSVDDALRRMVATIEARGELGRTVIVFLTDNGYEFGLHRLEGKRYPYDPSLRVPFAIRAPWAAARTDPTLVANVDLAATISDLAGVDPGLPQEGITLAPALRGGPLVSRRGVWIDWAGDPTVPAWSGVRTSRYTYVRNADGTEELYRDAADPLQLHNIARLPAARPTLDRLRALTDSLAPAEVGG
jgi:arylsulfatase A-like enzyme